MILLEFGDKMRRIRSNPGERIAEIERSEGIFEAMMEFVDDCDRFSFYEGILRKKRDFCWTLSADGELRSSP